MSDLSQRLQPCAQLEIDHCRTDLTSAIQAARGPSAVLLMQGAAGLRKDSVVLCHQVTTLDRTKLTKRIGELSPTDLSLVENGLKAALDLV